jgi:hypothetical protein
MHVICTNTNVVHPTWLSSTILGDLIMSNVSKRLLIMPTIILWHYLMKKGVHKTLSFFHADCLPFHLIFVCAPFSWRIFIWGLVYRYLTFSRIEIWLVGSILLQRPMIKMLWHCNFLNFGCGIVLMRHVICRNINLMHPTWLTSSIPRVCVSSICMRHVLDLALHDVHFWGSISLQWPIFINFIEFLLNKILLK